jgi:hypothetical protein
MLVTAGVASAEDLLAALCGKFKIVGYFIAARMAAKKDAIRRMLKLIKFHESLLYSGSAKNAQAKCMPSVRRS